MNVGGAHEAPPLAGELLVINDFWGRENQFSLGMLSQRGFCAPAHGPVPIYM